MRTSERSAGRLAAVLAVAIGVLSAPGAARAAGSGAAGGAKGAPAPAAAVAGDEVDPAVAPVVAKMQTFYERTRGFDTRFEQRFTTAIPSRLGSAAAKGRMRFRKPDGGSGPLMRWDYEDGRVLLLVKDTSFTYDPDTKQATEYRVDAANLSAAVTFLWGKGRLSEEFRIRPATRTDLSAGVALDLEPKKAAGGFQRVFLVVDPATGVVRESVVVQTNGSENRLVFVEPRLDATLDAVEFEPQRAFPDGTIISRAAVPGGR